MKRLFFTLCILFLVFLTKPIWIEPVQKVIPESVMDTFDSAKEFAHRVLDRDFNLDKLKDLLPGTDQNEKVKREPVESPELLIPSEQTFSIGNISLGDKKDQVTELYGEPMRKTENEYGVEWFTYHDHYHNFIMVAYDDQAFVRGLFTNQELLSTAVGLTMADSKEQVREVLGEPKETIEYPTFRYLVSSEGKYDIYLIDRSYVTIFYDVHQNDLITAVQINDQDLEASKSTLYTGGSDALKSGFEYQLFDLTNATRASFGLPLLQWDENVRETARKHSADMAANQYLSHTNLADRSFSDRMRDDGVTFYLAGENLAYGQFNSIFAHQGLMNSEGHRENILHEGFEKVGIGVDFNQADHPFYTVKFFAN